MNTGRNLKSYISSPHVTTCNARPICHCVSANSVKKRKKQWTLRCTILSLFHSTHTHTHTHTHTPTHTRPLSHTRTHAHTHIHTHTHTHRHTHTLSHTRTHT